jgi:GNAT superfamily N-acetyltransferase
MTIIRPAEMGDINEVYSLAADFATSFDVDRAAFNKTFGESLSAPNSYVAVAETQNRVGGYVLGFSHPAFYANGHVAWVEEIAVEESFRRQGVGRMLMSAFEEWATSRGARLVALATRRAASFYKEIGYEESALYFRKIMQGHDND